ncbi:hypothetical protein VTN00DRAFT_3566 [Thermoascus crustaceus]|uniref:uncharacterized protein n=1 Tax=Thermoascus crustaceus TaxID=5088 RepID=UPI003741FACD
MIGHVTPPTPPIPTSTSVAPIPTVIPGNEPIFQDTHAVGKRTLWVVTVLMGISSLIFYILAARVPVPKRMFHTLTALVTTISFITYLAMSTGDGITYNHIRLHESHRHVPDTHQDIFRQVYWIRYVNWMLTSPLILINLALLSGLNGAHLVIAIFADLLMFVGGIFGTFAAHDPRRWVWFTITCLSYLTVVHQIAFNGRRAASVKDSQTRRFFGSIGGFVLVVFALYPIILATSSLAHRVSIDTEIVAFAVLDILTQGIFGYWLLVSHDSSPSITLYVDGFWTQGIGNEGAIRVGEEDRA